MNPRTYIEQLESRIAPATIINPYTVTYQDGSGNTAEVLISKPLFTSAVAAAKILQFVDNGGNSITEAFTGNGSAENLNVINLLGRTDAQDMNITVKVIPQLGVGNLQVNVGSIEAANFSTAFQVSQNIDLGSVSIQGNLGQIFVGDDFSTPALASLSVMSMTSAFQSYVLGPITKMSVQGDFNANLQVIGYQFGSIGTLTIGGSLAGDAAGDGNSGVISFSGHIGTATIGNITGGAGDNSGQLVGTSINASSIGSLHVTGSITGGAGTNSGSVFAETSIASLTVDQNIVGGIGQNSGQVLGPLGTVKIGGSIMGGSGNGSGTVIGQTFAPGGIPAGGSIKSITVGGDVDGSSGQSSGQITGILGTVYIHGNLTGGSGIGSGSIFSLTFDSLGNSNSAAIGSVTILGNVTGGTAGVAANGVNAATPGDTGVISGLSASSISISGSLIGGTAGSGTNTDGVADQTADTSGAILVNSIASLKIGVGITGGTGPNSGIVTGENLDAAMHFGTVVVNGNVSGGTGATSGSILADGLLGGTITSLHIGGSLAGSSGTQSGEVYAATSLGSLFVGGSITGGTADNTGEVFSGGALTSAVIDGNLTGGIISAVTPAATLVDSGYIQAGHIGTLDIKGNAISGSDSAGPTANNGAIRSTADITTLSIGGTVTGSAANPFIISATQGVVKAVKPTSDLAIGTVTIGGAASYLDILAGYNPTVGTSDTPASTPLGTPVDGSAQIGTVNFHSTVAASNVVAGVEPDANGFFGTANNAAIAAHFGTVKSSIAKIIVAGTATGDSTPSDSFGFEAQNLGIVTVNGVSLNTFGLTAGVPQPVNGTNLNLLKVT